MRAAFAIAWRGLWRGKTFWTLLAAIAAAHLLLPGIVRSDGTQTGEFEMSVRVVFGTVAAVLYVVSLALGCGSFAREREEDLLALALVRPAPAFSMAAGRWLAIVLMMLCAVAVNAALLNFMQGPGGSAPPDCRIHVAPALPPVEVSAAESMEAFLKSDSTPDAVKKAPRAAILALLVSKESERYEVVRPGQTVSWPFRVAQAGSLAVQTRFSTMYSLKSELNGVFRFGALEGVVSNSTQAVLEIPLAAGGSAVHGDAGTLSFSNTGSGDVMLRPRRDIEMLLPGDSFVANSVRASAEMLALAGLLAAFGLFLSAALSRPVALFTAAVLLAAAFMAPDAVSQFPNEFNVTVGERIGLAISRAVVFVTSSVTEASPVSDLASGRAIMRGDLLRMVLVDLALLPAAFLSLAAFIVRRKSR